MAFQGRLAGGVGWRPGPRQAERAAHRTQASAASCGVPEETPWLVERPWSWGAPRSSRERGAPRPPLAVLVPARAWREAPHPGSPMTTRGTNTDTQHPPESRKRKAASAARPCECEALVPGRLRRTRLLGPWCPHPARKAAAHTIGAPPPVWGKGSQEIAFPSRASTGASQKRRSPVVALSYPHLLDRRKFPLRQEEPLARAGLGVPPNDPQPRSFGLAEGRGGSGERCPSCLLLSAPLTLPGVKRGAPGAPAPGPLPPRHNLPCTSWLRSRRPAKCKETLLPTLDA